MDPIPRHGNEKDPISVSDLNQIQNLSLKGHNQKLNDGADELKKQFKPSLGDDGSMPLKPNPGNLPFYSPTASCMCGGATNHPNKSKTFAFPDEVLYSAAEDPTPKKYSPFAGPSQYTLFSTTNVQNDDANSN